MRRLARDGRGAVAIIVALVFPVIFGIAALTVDIGHVLYMEAKLQAAADAAALAAASSLDDE
ncbi:MAG TPA: pilus assembly protein TadG-related protein, partial [Alphaproteobacteria bacterium]|nr:pilus assembly protein TadG-related protein [Alphaproteobacteria bacterium]HJP22976.1 pilus assembly protein TadG-related protein [Alphaproteobacteria bacterium]